MENKLLSDQVSTSKTVKKKKENKQEDVQIKQQTTE